MKTVTVRLPDDIHERLKADADLHRRSLNNQILCLIEDGLPEPPANPFAALRRMQERATAHATTPTEPRP